MGPAITIVLMVGMSAVSVPVDLGQSARQGPAPRSMRASMDTAESILLVVTTTQYRTVYRTEATNRGLTIAAQMVPYTISEKRFARSQDVRAYDAANREIDRRKLPELLAKERNVLVSADGKMVDPRHLRNVEKDTIILVIQEVKGPSGPGPVSSEAKGK